MKERTDMPPRAGPPVQHQYWNERLSRNWGLHGVGSLAYGRAWNRWLYRVRSHAFADACRRSGHTFSGKRVLDVGSGTGFYISRWRERGVSDIVGLDFSPFAVSRLRETLPGTRFLIGDIGERGFMLPQESFDAISAFDVLFHIVDDERYLNALRNMNGALRADGLLFYSDNFIRKETLAHEKYWKSRSLAEIESALDAAGFEVLFRIPIFVLMGSPVDLDMPRVRRLWDRMMRFAGKRESRGQALGAALYPLELLLRKIVREGPSTEIAVCRKR